MYSRRNDRKSVFASETEVIERCAGEEVPPATSAEVATPSIDKELGPTSVLPCSVSDAAWQGILLIDGRTIGRLVSPAVEFAPAPTEGREERPAAVGQLSLHFSRVVPAGAAPGISRAGEAQQQQQQQEERSLSLPVDECFPKRSYRVQVLGRQAGGGASFAAPHAFHADGRELTAGLNVQCQWQEYQQRHQAARTSAGQPVSAANFAHSSTLAVQSGDGLERLQAIFDVATRPAWLKGIVCRFLVAEPSQPQPATAEPVDGSGGCAARTTEQAESGAAAARAPAVDADSGMAAAPAAAAEGAEGQLGSWVAAKQRRLQQEWSQQLPAEDGPRLRPAVGAAQEQQGAPQQPAATKQQAAPQQPAAPAPEAGSVGPGRVAHAAVQQPTPAVKEGKTKSSRASRNAARKMREEQQAAPAGGSCDGSEPVLAALAPQRTASSRSSASSSASAASFSMPTPQPTSPSAAQRGKGRKAAQQPAAGEAAAPGRASSAGRGSGRRSRSSSRSRQANGQDATVVRRLPKLFPAAVDELPQSPNGGALAAVPERSEVPSSSSPPPAVGAGTVAHLPQNYGRRGSEREQRAGTSSRAGAGGSQTAVTASSARGLGRGRKAAAVASREVQTAPGAALQAPALPVPASAAGATAEPFLGQQVQLSEAEMLAADLLEVPPSAMAAALCGCGCCEHPAAAPAPARPESGRSSMDSISSSTCLAKHSPLSPTAAVWHCAAESMDAPAVKASTGAGTVVEDVQVMRPAASLLGQPAQGSGSGRSSSGSARGTSPTRPGSAAEGEWEGSVSSDGSRESRTSWQSGNSFLEPCRPSDWGLSYNFGHPSPLPFTVWEHNKTAGVSYPGHGQHVHSTSPPQPAPFGESLRSVRRSTGSFAQNRSLPMAGAGGNFYAMPVALHHAAASMPLLPLPTHHQRSGSNSSCSSEGTAPAAYPAAAAAGHRWQVSAQHGWTEPFAMPCHPQAYVQAHSQLVVQPQAFVQCPQLAPSQQQWAQQRLSSTEHSAGAYWNAHRCSGSGSGWQQPQAAFQHNLPPQHAAPGAHGRQAGSGGGSLFSSPAPPASSTSCAPYSAPASTVSSPQRSRGWNMSGAPPSSPPPPPLLTMPVLDLQVPESAEDSPDLERFLQAATPQVAVPASGAQDLTLADLWRWFEEPSTVGCEVNLVGGPRGPSTAYYLPYMSAVQLYVPAGAADEAAVAAAAAAAGQGQAQGQGQPPPQLLTYPNGLDSWPERMRPLMQWGEAANMRDRVPLHSRLADLCGAAAEEHPLMATRVADLHPFSWFAVAWYPLYCVPEAPLTARFLTFHTLASLWETASEAAAKHRQQQEQALMAAAVEAQRQWLQAAQEAAAAAAREHEGPGSAGAVAGATTPGSPGVRSQRAGPAGGLPSRPSYKSMLEAGLPPEEAQPLLPVTVTYTATPTAVCSFPGSPACSDAGTRTTLDVDTGSSRPQSVDGRAGGGSTCPAGTPAGRSRLALSSTADSLLASSCGGCSSVGQPGSVSASSASSMPASPPASEAGDSAEPLPVPVAGLTWYATGRDENWIETLVPAPLPAGISPAPNTPLPGGARLLGCWRGVAVLARPYPVAKGGPLGWEIQQEEMEQCAERLAAGAGLVALRPRPGVPGSWERLAWLAPAALGVSCPDYEFFTSRAARYC